MEKRFRINPLSPVLLCLLALSTLSAARHWGRKDRMTNDNYHQTIVPPNCVRIQPDLFMDQTEISNFHWLEYLYWNAHVFGRKSDEYRSALPDTTVWFEAKSALQEHGLTIADTTLSKQYLRHPAYRDYPVVGISQEQAKAFAKWRSDRVFEYLLIHSKMIERHPEQTSTNYFTIERYLGGSFMDYEIRSEVTHVPVFRLPTQGEWMQGLAYADSVYVIAKSKCRSKACRSCKHKQMYAHNIDSLHIIGKAVAGPTRPVLQSCVQDDQMIYHMRGNASEWCESPGATMGGGWLHHESEIRSTETFPTETPQAWTGMRYVCEWVPVEDAGISAAQ